MSLALNSCEDVACSNILFSCLVTLMFLQEKSRNEACSGLFLKLVAAYSIYSIVNLCETFLLQRNPRNTENL